MTENYINEENVENTENCSENDSENNSAEYITEAPKLTWGQFFTAFFRKMITNLVSAKIWAFWAFFIISCLFFNSGQLNGDTWAYTNLSALGLIFGMREFSKANMNKLSITQVNKTKIEEEKSMYI